MKDMKTLNFNEWLNEDLFQRLLIISISIIFIYLLIYYIKKTITKKITDAGKWPGTIATNKTKIPEFIEMGLKYIVYLVDCEILSASYSEVVDVFKKAKID